MCMRMCILYIWLVAMSSLVCSFALSIYRNEYTLLARWKLYNNDATGMDIKKNAVCWYIYSIGM